MSATQCLDCALFECDTCADTNDFRGGCCCCRIPPSDDYGEEVA